MVRRLQTDADYKMDLGQLMNSLGTGSGSSSRVPTGSNIHAVAHMVINYHDFDSQVTITVPTVS